MGGLLGDLVPLAVGVAVSPVPIIAVILMLSSKDALVNAVLFDVGWLFSIIATSAVFLLCFGSSAISGQKGTSTAADVIHVVLGVLLLLLGARRFVQKRKGAPEKQPRLLKSVEKIKPFQALLFGMAMIALNPKNLAMLLAALSDVIQRGASTSTNVSALAVFTLVASIGVLLPLVVYALFRERAASILGSWNRWLSAHNSTVMMYLLLVLGVLLVAKGIVGLA